jgi:ketosteroid isomerase-like protein
VARSEEVATSRFAEYNGNASEELASLIREGIQAFCEFFKNSQFDKMAQLYSPDTTVMLPIVRRSGVPAACHGHKSNPPKV